MFLIKQSAHQSGFHTSFDKDMLLSTSQANISEIFQVILVCSIAGNNCKYYLKTNKTSYHAQQN